MANKHIKLRLNEMTNKYVFGFRNEGSNWFIGNTPVEFSDNEIFLNNEKYTLTAGLLDLLTKEHPGGYTKQDLTNYKEILLLTNAHKRSFNSNAHIKSSSTYKYVNIIAKLFPANRKQSCKKKKFVNILNSKHSRKLGD